MELKYVKFSQFPRGTLVALLRDGYAFEKSYEKDWLGDWQEADRFFYDHPQIAGQCGFITTLDGAPIGFICWDPRNSPEYVEIGHNCIVTEYKGNGYGKAQLQEALRRIRGTGVQRIQVTTDERLLPAQRNYESVGFKRVRTRVNTVNPQYAGSLIDYEMICK